MSSFSEFEDDLMGRKKVEEKTTANNAGGGMPLAIILVSLFLMMAAAIFVGISREHKVIVKTYSRTFEIVGINRPKHFSVTLLDVENHNIFYSVGSSKHCNSWDNDGRPKMHDKIVVPVYEYYLSRDQDKALHYGVYDASVNNLFCD